MIVGDTPLWRRNKAFCLEPTVAGRRREQTLKCMCFGYNFPCRGHVVISVSCGLYDSRGSEPPSFIGNCHQLHFLRGLCSIHTQPAQICRWKLQCQDYLGTSMTRHDVKGFESSCLHFQIMIIKSLL